MKKIYIFLILLLGLHLFILSQLQFTAWPEMVSFPYLINHGFVLYKEAIHAYPPLLVGALAVSYKIFGYRLLILEIFGWSTILSCDVLIFAIVKKLTNRGSLVLWGVFIYTLLQPILDGNMVWPDLFIIPFLLLNFFLLTKRKYFYAGVAICFSILTKQTGVLFLGITGLWLFIYERKNIRNIFIYIFGILLPIFPVAILLVKQNTLADFLYWTIIYPSKYWTKFPGYVQLSPTLKENLILLILFLPFAFLIFRAKTKIFNDRNFLLLFGFLICGIIGVYPRFSFFHLQPAIPFLVISIIYLFSQTKFNPKYLLLIPVLVLVVNFRNLQFGGNRFWSDDYKLGRIINQGTSQNKPIYLLGLNSDTYAFSGRLPNKPWLDNFGWYLEIPGVQESVINGFRESPPSTVFWATPNDGNWYDIGTYQPKMIVNYIVNNYTKMKEIQKGVWEWVQK